MPRWLYQLQCALDPNWHPGFRPTIGPFYWRQPVVRGELLSPGNGVIYTQTRRYYGWRCVRCDTLRPEGWPFG